MRILLSFILSVSLFCSAVFALYEPTVDDWKFVEEIQDAIVADIDADEHSAEALLERYYTFEDTSHYHMLGTQKRFVVDAVMSSLRNKIDAQKQSVRDQMSASVFLDMYRPLVLTKEESLSDECETYYQLIDDWSWALDVPTALVIASWKMEASCKMYLPANGYGPFQITRNDYGTGDLSQKGFIETIRDFVDFSKSKRERYTYLNEDDGFSVQLFYTGYSFGDIVRHGALYNGLSGYTMYGDALPLNPDYVFGQFGEQYSGANKDGLLVNFLKVLKWEEGNL